jgi:hypothetical protein
MMRRRVQDRRGFGAGLLLAAAGMAWTSVHAAGWEFTPSVGVGVIYSDNITLAPRGSEESDWVLELTPGLDATYEGRSVDADISYRMSNYFYQDRSDLDQTFHRLAARSTAELVQESLFLDTGLAIRQQVVDPSVPIPTDSIAGSENLSDEYTAYISPRWTSALTENVRADVRYALGTVQYDDDALTDSVQHAVAGLVESTAQPDRLYWAARYSLTHVDFDERDDVRMQMATGELGWPVAPRTRLIVIGGVEDNDFDLADGRDAPDGGIWALGVRSQRGERFELEATAGERAFGSTFTLRWLQRGPRWHSEATYNEDYFTYAQTRLDIDPRSPEAILPGPGLGVAVGEVYLRERGQLSFGFESARTVTSLRVYDERRRYQTTLGEENLTGIDVGWNWTMRPRTTLRLAGGYQEIELLGTGSTDEVALVSASVEQLIGRNMVGSLLIRRVELDNDDLPIREYTENSVAARLIATF